MVYIPTSKYEEAYQRIVDGAHQSTSASSTTLLVFASIDADSICGLRILTSLFKRDAIGHKVIPVTNYQDIQAAGTQVASRQIKSLVFLNCGGQVDVQDLISLRDDLVVMIVDSHRPFNLYNVYWNEQVLCLDDGDVEKNMGVLRQAFEDIEFGSDVNDSDNEDDEDEDEEEEEAGSKRHSDEEPAQTRKKRRRAADMDPDEFIQMQRRRARKRDERAQNQSLIQSYYTQGSYYGQSCAISALVLCEQLGLPPTPDHVWWATIGATSQYVLQHIDANGYAVVVAKMRDLVRRVSSATAAAAGAGAGTQIGSRPNGSNPGTALSAANGCGHSDILRIDSDPLAYSSQMPLDSQLESNENAPASASNNIDMFNPYLEVLDENDDEGYAAGLNGSAVTSAASTGRLTSSRLIDQQTEIIECGELKFPLLRHWSLSEAMRFSPYVATRLATWSSKGRARLDLLLAKLGLSKAEAQAPFLHLAPELKRQLYRRMAEIGADYDMSDSTYRGFVRNYGWRKSNVAASDMVLALLALLLQGGEPQKASVTKGGFYAAYDALGQYDTLRRGIGGALDLQRLVVGQGVAMLERQAVKTLRAFRLAMLGDLEVSGNDGYNGPAAAFSSPFVLRQLALFLMQTLRERSKTAHARLPFIIAAPCQPSMSTEDASQEGQASRLLVLGITPLDYSLIAPSKTKNASATPSFSQSTFAGESRNHFGLVFEEVAADLGADVRQGFFDSSVLEISRSDMSAFIDKLRRHL
ncbi:DNA replication initiation factor cdc45 [Coemansia sp. RSA 1813]|nr:DNA replication initiation factor cdc45 [Coemansia sp. RSA 1646]KAJ2211728.1 DNA replication initiation factor cdc45 [Coemansia sp. RSA 487]KAJ2565613.1 DNA replication initiation factor cdc45 [Coemansia sp. RSA 1813]